MIPHVKIFTVYSNPTSSFVQVSILYKTMTKLHYQRSNLLKHALIMKFCIFGLDDMKFQ